MLHRSFRKPQQTQSRMSRDDYRHSLRTLAVLRPDNVKGLLSSQFADYPARHRVMLISLAVNVRAAHSAGMKTSIFFQD
ncbi:hypothetical protein PoB_002796900 [Plakobranchus ocellatus]|uniref:Uncharacterized protein n=1 Tax=Plakobranchus ocellatus TaxID=259542 RepID=A0AAV4A4E2_9GAST|nr:hypothetical protein PoB_002796900 [Plakobranchus ocellatus]